MKTPIVGIFDSGIGGLTVLGACARACPRVQFLYLGDNARAPYGSRPRGEISSFTEEALRLFEKRGADAAVIACNTATAACAEEMRAKFSFPVLGMEPAVRPAARRCKNVLVLATPYTAESGRLSSLLSACGGCRFTVVAASGLAGAIERRFAGIGDLTLSDHLPPPRNYDGVVLGCTHYVFFAEEIKNFYGCPVFDGNEGTARRLKSVLEGIPSEKCGTGNHFKPQEANICFTNNAKDFQEIEVIFLGKSRKLNKSIYKTNICSNNFEKSKKFF